MAVTSKIAEETDLSKMFYTRRLSRVYSDINLKKDDFPLQIISNKIYVLIHVSMPSNTIVYSIKFLFTEYKSWCTYNK